MSLIDSILGVVIALAIGGITYKMNDLIEKTREDIQNKHTEQEQD